MGRRALAGVLLAAIAAGLIAAGLHLFRRVDVERASRQVELAVDLNEFVDLAAQSGRDPDDVLRELRSAGATSAGVDEMTVDLLHRRGLAARMRGAELLGLLRAGAIADHDFAVGLEAARIDPDAVYLLFRDAGVADWFEANAARRLTPGTWHAVSAGGRRLVGLRLPEDRWDDQGFGIWPGDVQRVNAAGLLVIPKLQNPREGARRDFPADLDAVRAAGGRMSTVIFGGGQALGYPDALADAAAAMTASGAVQGMVEAPVQLAFIKQLGQEELVRLTGYRAARVYSIDRKELDKLTPQTVLDRWPRAVKERNIRVIYVRPMLALPAGEPPLPVNLRLVREAAERLRSDGWTLGAAQPFAPLRPPAWAAVLMASAILAGAAWVAWLSLPLPAWLVGAGWLVATLLGLYALVLGRGDLTRKALALLSAVAYPSLGLAWAAWRASRQPAAGEAEAPRFGAVLRTGAGLVLVPAAISLAGALLLAALLADNRYLLEIDYFRGVKLSLLLPMAIAAWVIIRHWGITASGRWGAEGRNVFRELERLAAAELRAWHVAALGLAAVAAYIYLGRSGHTAGLEVSTAEIQFRDWLERALVARPRTKEFLVGYPALMAAAWLAWRGWRPLVIPAVVAGGVALTSLVNSFEHMRTEFLLSLWRGVNGVALGLVVGAAGAFALERAVRRYLRWREHA